MLEALKGRTIVNTREEQLKGSRKVLVVELDDGSELKIGFEGGVGADSEWYQFAVVYLDDIEIWRG